MAPTAWSLGLQKDSIPVALWSFVFVTLQTSSAHTSSQTYPDATMCGLSVWETNCQTHEGHGNPWHDSDGSQSGAETGQVALAYLTARANNLTDIVQTLEERIEGMEELDLQELKMEADK